jgi:hypothetical protein
VVVDSGHRSDVDDLAEFKSRALGRYPHARLIWAKGKKKSRV